MKVVVINRLLNRITPDGGSMFFQALFGNEILKPYILAVDGVEEDPDWLDGWERGPLAYIPRHHPELVRLAEELNLSYYQTDHLYCNPENVAKAWTTVETFAGSFQHPIDTSPFSIYDVEGSYVITFDSERDREYLVGPNHLSSTDVLLDPASVALLMKR